MSTARKGQPERVLTKEEQYMDAQELVQQLVRGSANINRMREEINSVVSVVLSFVKTANPIFRATVSFCGTDYRWEVRYLSSAEYYEVKCWFKLPGCGESMVLAYSSIPNTVPFRMEDVMRVYRALPAFVDGMSQAVPGLAKEWQPLLDAADM